MNALTQERLKELLDYDPESGIFTWKVNRTFTARAGTVAGSRNGHGYLQIKIGNRAYQSHRLAWLYVNNRCPTGEIDHINGVRDDNRFSNLREVDRLTQNRNRGAYANNKSGCHGVRWRKDRQKWAAEIRYKGVSYHLGMFDDYEDAVATRRGAEVLFGFHPNHGRRLGNARQAASDQGELEELERFWRGDA